MFFSCTKDEVKVESKKTNEYNADFLHKYYDHICTTIRTTPGFFPPQAARAYGYIGIAGYEAAVIGIDETKSLQNQLFGFSSFKLPKPINGLEYHWAIAVNASTAQMIRNIFDINLSIENRKLTDTLEIEIHKELSKNINPLIAERSKIFGKNIADVVFAYSKTDGGHESYIDPFQLPYTLPFGAHVWEPTGSGQRPLSPKWGNNRPFLTNNVTKTSSGPPVAYSENPTSEFYKEATAVYQQVKGNTTEQIEIARYWSDDPFSTCTPAGHSFNILSQILQEDRATLAKAVVSNAKMGVAENDAFIACWKGKYDYLLLRPYTYIRRFIDPNFNTILGSPPFPAYTSGHSCEVGAATRILTSLFGNGNGHYQFTDYSQVQYGLFARSFTSFEQMSEECANSRLYGGIHYPMDNSKGLQVGSAIGDNVNKEILWAPFDK